MKKIIGAATVALALAVPSSSLAAPTTQDTGPQLLTESACNQGTTDARDNGASNTKQASVPHEGQTIGCHHANPSLG